MRVSDWLSSADPESSAAAVAEENSWVKGDTLDTRLVFPAGAKGYLLLAVSRGARAVAVYQSVRDAASSTVSVLYPAEGRTVSLPVGAVMYVSLVFVESAGKEQLAMSTGDSTVHLWDVERGTKQVVYRYERRVLFNLCAVDDTTIACGDVRCENGVYTVELIDTSAAPWKLKKRLDLDVGLEVVSDMCYVQQADGSQYLVLCLWTIGRVVAVKLDEDWSKPRLMWRFEQNPETFRPTSVCIDGAGSVFVTDVRRHRVLMLSAEDGALLGTVLTRQQHGIVFPYSVRWSDDQLYVMHRTKLPEEGEAEPWVVSTFHPK